MLRNLEIQTRFKELWIALEMVPRIFASVFVEWFPQDTVSKRYLQIPSR